ncbi:MAG: VanZ family protein [Lachnospiraceae bacterium]|nr:VanZ family protein [Lachnospiraceae bacterium]
MKTRETRRYIGILFWGIATLTCMIIIFFMSHKPAPESAEMSGFIVKWLLSQGIGRDIAESLDLIVRKCAHMAEYFALTFSATFFLIYIKGSFYVRVRLTAVLFAFLYAISDEVHQLFVEGRAGRATDVLIDSVGIGIAFVVTTFLIKYCRKPRYSANNVKKSV